MKRKIEQEIIRLKKEEISSRYHGAAEIPQTSLVGRANWINGGIKTFSNKSCLTRLNLCYHIIINYLII